MTQFNGQAEDLTRVSLEEDSGEDAIRDRSAHQVWGIGQDDGHALFEVKCPQVLQAGVVLARTG